MPTRRWGHAVGVVQIGVAVVGGAFEATVELIGAAAVRPRDDVVDVAPVGRDVATGGVPAVAVADLDGPAEGAGEGAAG